MWIIPTSSFPFFVTSSISLMIRYLTSLKSNIVSVTIFEIFATRVHDLDIRRFTAIQGQSSWRQSIAHGWFPIRLPLTQSLYLSPFSQYLTCNFDDLEVGQFNVIQDQKPVGGFLSDLFWVQHCISLHIRDIWWVHGNPRSKVMLPIDSPWVIWTYFLFDFYWSHHLICHHFWNIWLAILMTLN